ncbi:MAG: hypothetical protein CVT95_04620 [Bacteroidetes bacterium HGW-Bacteroidetes-12]|jgi:transcriptional regulator with XRE-family HTH domain|nr:MAG: hypothetical protein CVT95_04620 [Bacteroidetes bacterium HGW-Bacteroidetes-12]
MTTNNLLKKIKLSRISKDWTQEKMAKKLSVSIPTYSRFERGSTKIKYAFLQKVCAELDINLTAPNYEINNDNSLAILEENEAVYDSPSLKQKTTKFSVSEKDLNDLINLLEKQQEISRLLLKKIRSLHV